MGSLVKGNVSAVTSQLSAQGQYTIDRATGLTRQSKLETRLKGVMNFGGQEVPVEIVNRLSIQRK